MNAADRSRGDSRRTLGVLLRRAKAGSLLVVIGSLGVGVSVARGQTGQLDSLLDGEGATASEERGDPAAAGAKPASASPEAPRRRVIEEIIVTAQKREESILDVPISMSVLDDEFMKQEHVSDFRDIGLFVPNANIDNSATYPDVIIRGFGTDLANKAFEQPVGLVIDGVPFSRVEYWQGPLFDLERVEVLRGPQGTLFGKNTTAGLFNVVTKKPTDDLTGSIDVELGELDRRRIEAAIGGPVIADLVNFRIAALLEERDGLNRNTTAAVAPLAADRLGRRDRKGIRSQLGFPGLFGANLVVGYEHIELDMGGPAWELREVPDPLRGFFQYYDPNTDFVPGNHVGSLNGPEFAKRTLDTVVANAGYELFEWDLAMVASYSFLKARMVFDNDTNPSPLFLSTTNDDNPQTTLELRAASPSLPGFLGLGSLFGFPLGTTNLTGGIFYFDRALEDSVLSLTINLPVAGQMAAYRNSPVGSAFDAADFVGPAVQIGDIGVFDTASITDTTTGLFDQQTTSIAGFGQIDWHVTDHWTLQSGMRLTQEEKNAHWQRMNDPGSFWGSLGFQEFTANFSQSEVVFAPKLALQYAWNEDINSYASWAKGFRAGGYNEFAPREDVEEMTFERETVTSWEVGSKARLFGGVATAGLGLYRMHLENFQLFTFDPTFLLPFVVNAGEARAQGAEADLTWLATDWLTVRGALGLNDAKFIKFPFGPCAMDRENTDGDGDARCDLSGRPLYKAPRWTGTVAGDVRLPLSSLPFVSRIPLDAGRGIDLLGGLSVEYQDPQFIYRTLDPRVREPSFFRLNGSIGLGDLGQGWSLRMVVENLTDEDVFTQVRELSLSDGGMSHLPDPPRLVSAVLRWAF